MLGLAEQTDAYAQALSNSQIGKHLDSSNCWHHILETKPCLKWSLALNVFSLFWKSSQ
jgi:hypothetical protein